MLKRYYAVDNLPVKRLLSRLYALAPLTGIIGCSRAPSFNLLGSYFPSWMLCGVIGIFLTVAARLFFLKIGFEQHLSPLILVYPCLTAFFMFTLWLLFFS
jgi:hypothetical protein